MAYHHMRIPLWQQHHYEKDFYLTECDPQVLARHDGHDDLDRLLKYG